MRAHLYTAVYRYIKGTYPPCPPQRIAAQRKDLGLHGGEGGGSEGEGGGGFGWDPPSSQGPPVVPGGRRTESFEAEILLAPKAPKRNLAVGLKHWKGRRGGGVLLQCTAVLIHHWTPTIRRPVAGHR